MGEISDLNAMTSLASNDLLLISDVSDAVDKNKKLLANAFAIRYTNGVAGNVTTWQDADHVQDAGFAAANVALADGSRVVKSLSVGGVVGSHSPKTEPYLVADPAAGVGARFFARAMYILNTGGWLYPITACGLRAYFLVTAFEESAGASNSATLTVTATAATLVVGTTTLTFQITSGQLQVQKNTGTAINLAVIGVAN